MYLHYLRIAHNEQELSKVGSGWSERAKAYDERTQILSGLLNMIAQKVPSDLAIEAQRRTKTLQKCQRRLNPDPLCSISPIES